MGRIKPPLVFLGPTLSVEEARKVLPQAEYCKPAARGDLYRARFLGTSLFVLIDGVFHQSYAPSPRELVDVVRDGANVVGASSMGALRAAECWPVGMHGVGLIYRLFRSGLLQSDEEVAVTYDDDAQRPLSVPLVNVRYSTHRAVREGLLDRSQRDAIVQTAADIFYAERTWARIFSGLSFSAGAEQQRFLESIDLKRRDAQQALALVARWLEGDPRLAERHLRRSEAPFVFTEHVREPEADALAHIPHPQARSELARWMLTSGRFKRYADALIGPSAVSQAEIPPSAEGSAQDDLLRASRAKAGRAVSVAALVADFDRFAKSLWAELTLNGERDAELFRLHAVRRMAEGCESPEPADLYQAELQILAEHGVATWEELELWGDANGLPREWFRETLERKARAMLRSGLLFAARSRTGGER